MGPLRARDLGIAVGSLPPGENDAITDVAGVRVGHATVVEGEAVRTGVTVVQPHDGSTWERPVFAGAHRLNGNGELTGLEWVRESGFLTSPVGLTNTHSVGVVRDALIGAEVATRADAREFWSLPVVGETWDGVLNDINGMHVRAEHVYEALASAAAGPVAEGNVGSGTGMICHGFKGGIGTASRVVEAAGGYTVGVLVQANHGRRERLTVNGVPVGAAIPFSEVPGPAGPTLDRGGGSIIVVVATDAPLLPGQCERLAQRAGLGIARTGGVGENFSGDLFLCFATGNDGLPAGDYGAESPATVPLQMLANHYITPLFDAVVEATEAAIVNVLLAAQTMTGRDGNTVHAIGSDRLVSVLERHGALAR
ncbi:MAG: P1 family peptidase [Actinobacteria bacterium]|nr:P1 family peptidase [Actinomycetota bacterium]